jgi:hypothetical protein
LNKWAHLTSKDEVRASLKMHPEVLNGDQVDETIVDILADRLWLVILNRRQSELLLTREELLKIHPVLQRKGFM